MTRGSLRSPRPHRRVAVLAATVVTLACAYTPSAVAGSIPTGAGPTGSGLTGSRPTSSGRRGVRLIISLRTRPRRVRASRATLPASAAAMARGAGGDVGGVIAPGVFSVDVPSDHVDAAISTLSHRSDVQYVQRDQPVRGFVTPNDPCVTLCPFPRPSQWSLGKINAFQAWDTTKGSSDVLVAVLDSVVTTTNPDLTDKVIVGPTFAPAANSSQCGSVLRIDHGTNVAGIIAAVTDNAIGIAGLGWNTRVLSVTVLDDHGCGDTDSVAKGIYAAADTPGVRVINLSLGITCDAGAEQPCPPTTMGDAVAYAQKKGILVVAAAGNGDGGHGLSTPTYPAAFPGVVAVAASDESDHLWSSSNYGPWVDLAAPGVDITSTYQNYYATFEGTSEASPFVAATAALIMAAHPELSASEVAARIYAHTDWIPGTGTAIQHGRLDAGGAVQNPPRGYWEAGLDGAVYTFGTAGFFGSAGSTHLKQPVVGIAATPSGNGYWLVARDGGVFAYGDAQFQGSTGAIHLNQPIVGMAATPSGNGYWLVASDGGMFAFGDAPFLGSTGALQLAQPIVGMAATASGNGYWLVARDGGMFAFGDAPFLGSTGGQPGVPSITKMAVTATGKGYWLLGLDGSVAAFGDAPDLGKPAAAHSFVIGIANRP